MNNNNRRIELFPDFTEEDFKEFWNNCLNTPEDWEHINRYSEPYPMYGNYDTIYNYFQRNETYLIKLIENNSFIGFAIHGNFIPSQPNSVGVVIGSKYSGNGYGTEALSILCELLRERGLENVNGYCNALNNASIKMMERNNFILQREFEFSNCRIRHYRKEL